MIVNKNPLVSVIITTKNEEKNIGRLLDSIQKQTYPNIETILVDNNSTDKTIQIAKKYKCRIFYKGPERSVQRNYGAKHSQGKFLLFLDADMEQSPEVVSECVHLSEKTQCGGLVIPEESVASNFWEKVKSFERSFYNEAGDDSTDAARFFSKTVFERAGGYDESITGPEDWDLPESIKKMGYQISRIKSKIYHYERIKSLASLGKKKFYYALNSHKYLKKQKISSFSSKTIYFLRPVFYKQWSKFLKHPLLGAGMMIMLSTELIYGGLGFLKGKFKKI